MRPMRYERMVRNAFGGCERFGDPAKTANTDCYSDGNLDTAKTGTAYAITHASQVAWSKDNQALADQIERLYEKVWSATEAAHLDDVVDEVLAAQKTLGIG